MGHDISRPYEKRHALFWASISSQRTQRKGMAYGFFSWHSFRALVVEIVRFCPRKISGNAHDILANHDYSLSISGIKLTPQHEHDVSLKTAQLNPGRSGYHSAAVPVSRCMILLQAGTGCPLCGNMHRSLSPMRQCILFAKEQEYANVGMEQTHFLNRK
jgi:hypothetical protein